MRASLNDALHAEQGQTLVLFVAILTGLVVLLAFVVDVGAWLGTKHRLQSVADSAAVAAVQTGQVGPAIDDGWAKLGPDLTSLNPAAPPDSFTVTATHDAPIIFGGLAGITGFTETVSATARAEPASSLNNMDLMNVATADASRPPYIPPIVVNECVFSLTCSSTTAACFGAAPGCELDFDSSDPGGSFMGLANISCPDPTGACSPPPSRFSEWVTCATCFVGPLQTGTGFPILSSGVSSPAAVAAMESLAASVPPSNLMLPVFTWDSTRSLYAIVGFSRLVLTGLVVWQAESPACAPRCKAITGYFENYNLPASFPGSGGSGPDYGVRKIGLTN